MDNLLSHPFADLFALLSPDSIPKWTSVVDLLRRLSDIEHQLGGEDAVTEWLEKLESARDLLRETEEQLVELYDFDRHINDLAEAIGEVHTPGDQVPDLALGKVARKQGSGKVEYEDNAEAEICRSLMGVVNLAEAGVSGQGSEVLDIEEYESAEIQAASHQDDGASTQATEDHEVHDLDIEECETADNQAASHQAEGARRGQSGGVAEYEGNAEVEICQWFLKCVMGARGQASEGHDVDIEEAEMDFVEVVEREGSASHQFEGASGQAGEDDDPDEEHEGNKDVEMS